MRKKSYLPLNGKLYAASRSRRLIDRFHDALTSQTLFPRSLPGRAIQDALREVIHLQRKPILLFNLRRNLENFCVKTLLAP